MNDRRNENVVTPLVSAIRGEDNRTGLELQNGITWKLLKSRSGLYSETPMSEELMAVINVMAYGYEASVSINGLDIGIAGGKSESMRLFGRDDPMVSQLPAEMKNLACLKSGVNEVAITCKRVGDQASSGLSVEIKTADQSGSEQDAFVHQGDPGQDAESKTVTGEFNL